VSRATFGSLPWRSRSQHDLAAKLRPAHNFFIWSRISKIFHRNDHHIESTSREQHLGRYLEGQGHMQSCPAHIFVIWSQILQSFYIIDHHIDTTCRAQHLGRYLEGQGHSMTFQQNNFRPITLWFEVEYYNYFTGMITILRQCVACNIWVATLKAKVTTWPSKIVSGPKCCYLKSDFTTTFDKLLLCPIPIRGALPGSDRLLLV